MGRRRDVQWGKHGARRNERNEKANATRRRERMSDRNSRCAERRGVSAPESAEQGSDSAAQRDGAGAGRSRRTASRTQGSSAERLSMLRWASDLGAVTAEALARRDQTTRASATARLSAATAAGLLARSRPLTRSPSLYAPTRAGMRECDERGLHPCRVSAANAEHLATCAVVAATLQRLLPDERVMGERVLRREEREHSGPLASAKLGIGPDGTPLLHRPDLVLWPPHSDAKLPVTIEVELSVKSRRRLEAICRAWARCRLVAGVIYLAAPEVEAALLRAIAAAQAQRRVTVIALESLAVASLSQTVPTSA